MNQFRTSKITVFWDRLLALLTLEKWKRTFRNRVTLPRLKLFELRGVSLDVRDVSLRMRDLISSDRYETSEVMMCDEIIKSTDRVLELGSAIGFIGIYCQKILGVSKYFSIEANATTIAIAEKNYCLNKIEPRIFNAAINSRDEVVSLFPSDDFFTSSITTTGSTNHTTPIAVQGITFKKILDLPSFECTALIVDVEGAEIFLNPDEIPTSVCKIIIELHPEKLGVSEMFIYLMRLCSVGFRVHSFHYHTFALTR